MRQETFDFTVTDEAAAYLCRKMDDLGLAAVRLAVQGGGCSGFQYEFSDGTEKNDDDVVVERNGARIVIDRMSQPYLAGCTLLLKTGPLGQPILRVDNPNATGTCGCGHSFSA